MNDDWRLRVRPHEKGIVHSLVERLDASELEHDLEASFHDRVIVSVDGPELFCYAGSRAQAERVERLIRSEADKNGWSIEYELTHWHPTAEEWEDPDEPLPDSDTERAEERSELMARERGESQNQGFPEYEVRIRCPSRHQAAELADRLRGEGLPSVQRSNFLLVGALDEDSATALAERLRAEAPTGSAVVAEATLGAVMSAEPNPFAVFGGLGG
jgi:hypothetical protein